MPPSRIVISSESEKSFSFAVKNRGEERDHGKHRTPCDLGKGGSVPPPRTLFPHLNTRTGWRPVRAVFLESSEWSSHKTIGL